MSVDSLPTLNAILNATSGILLVTGYIFIRRKRPDAHRLCMISALTASCLFLISYVTYHVVFARGVTRFTGEGLARGVYLTILTSHTILAVVIVPFVLVTVYRAAKRRFTEHRRVARWTFPMWLYVSITGVIVYVMLYHIYPSR
jgi:uncharacterized membrane protein YozB (DUF420 family)